MSSSISSATVAVEKATSDLLIGPDWTMNIDICDSVNSSHWQAKDVVKAVKRRLQHKNAKVQLLALTLLETMVKNCGDFVHFQIAEKNILGEMVKIVKKKADMQVRDKILSLLDSWQEAFGGAGGKFPQYYWAYDELRRSGVEFPKRLLDSAPIFTPPATHPNLRHAHAGYGMPIGSSRRLDETMATEIESLSLSSLESMQNVVELLDDMLQAVNPSDRVAVKDEVIVDLVSQCRSNQKKLMQMLTTTGDEELLARGLELNDSLQSLLAKHDAIASGSPFPTQHTNISSKPTNVSTAAKPTDLRDSSPQSSSNPPTPVATNIRNQIDEDEEEEDDFAQLARRHSRVQLTASPTTSAENNGSPMSMDNNINTTSQMPAILDPAPCNTLSLPDPPAPSRTTNEQEIIDLLSITLSTTAASPCTPPHPSASNQSMHQTSVSTSMQGCPRASQTNLGSEEQVPFNSYVVPWAQSQLQTQSQLGQHLQSRSQLRPHPQRELQAPYQAPFQMQSQPQFWPQSQSQLQSRLQPQIQQQFNPQYSQYSSGYPPPPWAASSENYNHRRNLSNNTPRATASSTQPLQVVRPLQQYNSFPARAANGSPTNGVQNITRNPASAAGQKPFIPSYRLFEDLNVLGSAEGRLSSKSPSLAGTSGQGMLGGRK